MSSFFGFPGETMDNDHCPVPTITNYTYGILLLIKQSISPLPAELLELFNNRQVGICRLVYFGHSLGFGGFNAAGMIATWLKFLFSFSIESAYYSGNAEGINISPSFLAASLNLLSKHTKRCPFGVLPAQISAAAS